MEQSVKKITFLVLGIISGLLFLDGKKVFCDNNKITPKDTSEATRISLSALANGALAVETVDIKEKYGINFSDIEKMSQEKIFQLTERFMIEQKNFNPSSPDEKIVMDKIEYEKMPDIDRKKDLWVSFHRTYKGIPIWSSGAHTLIRGDNKILVGNGASSNINLSTTPLISKEQAIEIAKKNFKEYRRLLHLPDSIIKFKYTADISLPKNTEISKANVVKFLKTFGNIKNDSLLCLAIADTGKMYIDAYPAGNETGIRVRALRTAISTAKDIDLVDTVSTYILPLIGPGAMEVLPEFKKNGDYLLVYSLYLSIRSDEYNTEWQYWIDAITGKVICRSSNSKGG